MKWLGSQLKEYLRRAGVSQVALAKHVGVSRQTVVDWTKGQIPKGTHLLGICEILDIDPGVLFDDSDSPVQVAPMHRRRRNAKVTPAMQRAAHDLAQGYANLLEAADLPPLEMVARSSGDELSAENLARQMRALGGLSNDNAPIDYSHAFRILDRLGICVVFRTFPGMLKGYAFYTVVNDQRLVIVNATTKLLDLIFPLLHETVHAVRNRTPKSAYAKAEEDFCDRVAGLVQFPDTYVDDAFDAIDGRAAGAQVNALKKMARRHHHALFGLVRRIEERHGELSLAGRSVNGADANLRRECPTIGEILLADGATGFLEMLAELSPSWSRIVRHNVDAMTTSRLAEVLDLAYVDARAVQDELRSRREGQACGRGV